MSSNGRGASAAEDSIVPMTLVSLEAPTQQEAEALETLYQTAAQTAWVLRLGDCQDVPQATDLETAMRHGQAGRWTRGLLVQARPYDFLTPHREAACCSGVAGTKPAKVAQSCLDGPRK